jgi:hypothetical protein
VPKLRMGPVSRLFVCHGVPPLVRLSIIAQKDQLGLKLRPVGREAPPYPD